MGQKDRKRIQNKRAREKQENDQELAEQSAPAGEPAAQEPARPLQAPASPKTRTQVFREPLTGELEAPLPSWEHAKTHATSAPEAEIPTQGNAQEAPETESTAPLAAAPRAITWAQAAAKPPPLTFFMPDDKTKLDTLLEYVIQNSEEKSYKSYNEMSLRFLGKQPGTITLGNLGKFLEEYPPTKETADRWEGVSNAVRHYPHSNALDGSDSICDAVMSQMDCSKKMTSRILVQKSKNSLRRANKEQAFKYGEAAIEADPSYSAYIALLKVPEMPCSKDWAYAAAGLATTKKERYQSNLHAAKLLGLVLGISDFKVI
jgi:hypothetical protein